MAKRALITGITGQDGSYLAELLLAKGYQVHGMVRRSSEEKFVRIAHLEGKVVLHQGDLLDQFSLVRLFADIEPDEIYNLAAQSFVPTSWNQPVLTREFTGLGVTKILEAIRYGAPRANARRKLRWDPTIHLRKVVELMVDADLSRLKAGAR